jgi:hypothetical protein
MAIHGFPRATIDIDLLIGASDLERAWALARENAYDVEGLPRLYTLDLLLVTEQLANVWTDRELIEWEQGKTWVVSKAGQVELKRISGRPQDLVDIERLEAED